MPSGDLFIGLMSGTSADGIDAVLVRLEGRRPELLGYHHAPFNADLRQGIHNLADSDQCSLDQLGELDTRLGEAFGQAALTLLSNAGIGAQRVGAIGSHGQTVRHRPPGHADRPFSLQIGDPNRIAELTGITTVADFRRRDLAAGGQGAPLVPAFHAWAWQSPGLNQAIVNVGGMSNITLLPARGDASGFDLGPGNVLMDAWIAHCRQMDCDRDGRWAASGQVAPALLSRLLSHPFLRQQGPKSTGREAFNLHWLRQQLADFAALAPEDVQASLCEFSARVIADAVPGDTARLLVCGGGAYNGELMRRLRGRLPACQVDTTQAEGVEPQRVEACAFAWLARETLAGRPGNLPGVTGAAGFRVLGAIYPA